MLSVKSKWRWNDRLNRLAWVHWKKKNDYRKPLNVWWFTETYNTSVPWRNKAPFRLWRSKDSITFLKESLWFIDVFCTSYFSSKMRGREPFECGQCQERAFLVPPCSTCALSNSPFNIFPASAATSHYYYYLRRSCLWMSSASIYSQLRFIFARFAVFFRSLQQEQLKIDVFYRWLFDEILLTATFFVQRNFQNALRQKFESLPQCIAPPYNSITTTTIRVAAE